MIAKRADSNGRIEIREEQMLTHNFPNDAKTGDRDSGYISQEIRYPNAVDPNRARQALGDVAKTTYGNASVLREA